MAMVTLLLLLPILLGNYSFNNLTPGDYTVVETQPEELSNVSEDEGGIDDDKPDDGVVNSIALPSLLVKTMPIMTLSKFSSVLFLVTYLKTLLAMAWAILLLNRSPYLC